MHDDSRAVAEGLHRSLLFTFRSRSCQWKETWRYHTQPLAATRSVNRVLSGVDTAVLLPTEGVGTQDRASAACIHGIDSSRAGRPVTKGSDLQRGEGR